MPEQSSALGRQSIFDAEVIIRGRNVGDIVAIEASCVRDGFGDIVLPGRKVEGTTRVHC